MSQKVALICAGVRFERNRWRSVSDDDREAWARPEVEKLAVMVGRFTVEDELKAGAMGPNSPAMKYAGTDDCRWAAGGFAVICTAVLHMSAKKYTETSFIYYDPTAKTYQYHAVDSSGEIEDKSGTVSGDTWTGLARVLFQKRSITPGTP